MAADANLIKKSDLIAQSIDFDEQFTQGIKKLLEALGVTRMRPMAVGSQVKIYNTDLTKATTTAGEGEVIPLSKVAKSLKATKELTYNKYRKQTSFEAIQSTGFKGAVTDTDTELVREMQKDIKSTLYGAMLEGTSSATGTDLQAALANSLGTLAALWEDYDVTSVAFMNPQDVYGFLGGQKVDVQSAFGLNYIQNFLGVNVVIMSAAIPKGKIATTVSGNMNFFYADVRNGEAAKAFDLQPDESGLIGTTHRAVNESLNYETVAVTSGLLVPERADGIVVATIGANQPSTPEGK
ncbi:MAG: hypothetical protein Q4E15_06445 [Lactobacillus johnsonii]|nr:hypothetical protein [Lactobacillus johnsonii]